MLVSEVMSRAAVTDSANDPLTDAAARMWRQQTGSLLVMDGETLLGIITERDVMKAVARGLDLTATPVSAVMTTAVQTVTRHTDVADAARHMSERWIRHLPVVEEGQVLGMVSQRDLCGVLAAGMPSAAPDDVDLVRDRRLARVDAEGPARAQPVAQTEPSVLPDVTRDETSIGWGDDAGGNDERLRADRPPHWE